jgi:hypothetical protein
MGRFATILAGLIVVVAAACVDLSSPKDSPASISLLQLPELFIVRGDLMRDSLGNPGTPAVVAYDGNGSPMTGFTPTFFVTDSNPLISFNSSGVLAAKNTVGQGHVIGQIGNVQTPAALIYVTVEPTTLGRAASAGDTVHLVFGNDSSSSIATFPFSVSVKGGTGAPSDTGVGGAIVRYTMISQPLESRSGSPVAYIADASHNPSVLDTTDAGGNASHRSLVVNSKLLADAAIAAGTKIDSVIVEASMRYRGVPLRGSPVRFVVKVKGGFGT